MFFKATTSHQYFNIFICGRRKNKILSTKTDVWPTFHFYRRGRDFFLHCPVDTEIDFLEDCLNVRGPLHVCQVHNTVDQQFSEPGLCRYIRSFSRHFNLFIFNLFY